MPNILLAREARNVVVLGAQAQLVEERQPLNAAVNGGRRRACVRH